MATDIGLIIAISAGCTTIVASTIAMFLWQRSEANADRRHFQDIQREDRKELLQISRNLEITVGEIQKEMKDFHSRLLEIERNRK